MRFSAKFSKHEKRLSTSFGASETGFKSSFGGSETGFNSSFGAVTEVARNFEYYDKEYQATPAVVSQTFETADKIMAKDFEVNAIPYAEVTNQADGKTVTIG